MSPRAHGQIRRSQAITTWGPGALIDLPSSSGIVGGLETWPKVDRARGDRRPAADAQARAVTGVPGAASVRAAGRLDRAREPDARDRRVALSRVDARPGGGGRAR